MGSVRKSMPKQKQYTLFFNKDCDIGKSINEHLLPEQVQKPSLSELLVECVEKLNCANIQTDSIRFTKLLMSKIGNYYEINVASRSHLSDLLKQVCELFEACPNFIAYKKNNSCENCDGDGKKAVEKPPVKKVTPAAKNRGSKTPFSKKTKAKVSLTRMDFSKMASHGEIALPPKTQSFAESVIENDSSMPAANIESDNSNPNPASANKVNITIVDTVYSVSEMKESSSTLVTTIRRNTASPLARGEWSMAYSATPQSVRMSAAPMSAKRASEAALNTPVSKKAATLAETPNTSRADASHMSVEELVATLQGGEIDPQPPTEMPNEREETEDEVNLDDTKVLQDNEHGTVSGDTKNDDAISLGTTSDESEFVVGGNRDGNESRVYDIQDEMELLDPTYFPEELTADQVAEFIVKIDPTMDKFAMFLREQKIDEKLVPTLLEATNMDIRSEVPSTLGEVCRFRTILGKLKNDHKHSANIVNSTFSRAVQ